MSVDKIIQAIANEYAIPFANLRAVVQVESNGVFSAKVNGRDEPLIRWEGHYFYRRLSGAPRERAVAQGLASPRAQAIANPNSQELRWNRLLLPAAKINRVAAYESCSWGLGQVMGSHWRALEFASVDEFVSLVRDGIDGQIRLMLYYCVKNNLIGELKRGDFTAFARAYNGPNFRQNNYDGKMRDWARHYGKTSATSVATINDAILRLGSKGLRVRELQTLLLRAGIAVKVDGDFGPATRHAVQTFQIDNALTDDGIVGNRTWAVLDRYRVQGEQPGKLGMLEAVAATPEGRQGAATALGGIAVASAANIAPTALKPALTGFGGLLTILGTLWAAYGWRNANKVE